MCGILALVGQHDQHRRHRKPDHGAANRALDALARRGPDGHGLWTSPDENVILGHRRLAIVDIAGGAQPIENEDGSCVLAFNGEIYGHAEQPTTASRAHEELRRSLEAKGHRFRSRCDAEIALHLYEELGPSGMLAELRGEYAFVLWDAKNRVLFAARDRFGVKPLVYAEHDGVLHVASRANALFAAGVPARWDHDAFFHAASLQYTLPDETLFANVRVLPPGHFLLAHDGHVRIKQYWDLDYPPLTALASHSHRSIEDAANELRERLLDAVRVRLVADVPVAFQLSGGIDSSAVLALAASVTDKPLDAFTVSFTDDARYDELAIAQEMALKVGARLHVVEASAARLLEELPLAIADGEGLAVNAHIAAKRVLARSVHHAGFKVVLTGEGADEVLAGYAHLRSDLAEGVVTPHLGTTNVVSNGLMLPALGDVALDTSAVQRPLGFVPTWLRAKATLGARVHAMLDDDYRAGFARADPYALMLAHVDVARQLTGRGRVEQASYLWSKLALEGYILRTLGDGMEMSASVEGRLPFLDHHFFELVRSLPTHFKINREGVEKAVLRMAVGPLLTDRLRSRQKHPFLAPPVLTSSFPTSTSPLILDLLRGQSLPSFFDAKKIRLLLDRLPQMTAEEQIATEPALMMVLSATVLQSSLHLS